MSLRKTCHICVYLMIFISSYLFLEKIVREWNLNQYYYEQLTRYNMNIFRECQKTIRCESAIDWAVEKLEQVENQMRQDAYTRAEVKKMSSEAMLDSRNRVSRERRILGRILPVENVGDEEPNP